MALIPHQSWHRCLANRFRPISLEATPTDLYFVRSYFNLSTFEDRRDEDHFLFTDSQLIVLLLIIQTFATDCQNCSVELSLLQTFWRVGGWYNKQIWRAGNHLCREKPSRFLDATVLHHRAHPFWSILFSGNFVTNDIKPGKTFDLQTWRLGIVKILIVTKL